MEQWGEASRKSYLPSLLQKELAGVFKKYINIMMSDPNNWLPGNEVERIVFLSKQRNNFIEVVHPLRQILVY